MAVQDLLRVLPFERFQNPPPVVAVSELGNSSVNFVVRPWVKSADYWAPRWELTPPVAGFTDTENPVRS